MSDNRFPATEATPAVFLDPQMLLTHWQGHRRLTRRVIEAFPEEAFNTYSIGGMRPFAQLMVEVIGIAEAGLPGIATGAWKKIGEMEHHAPDAAVPTKEELLRRWDALTAQFEAQWPQIPVSRFRESDKAFGAYEGPIYSLVLYMIDNEIHHRAQGYVYLRALGIEPPFFWDRS